MRRVGARRLEARAAVALVVVLAGCGSGSSPADPVADAAPAGPPPASTTSTGPDVVRLPTADRSPEPPTQPPAVDETVVATATAARIVARATPADDGTEVAAFDHPIATGGPLVFQVVGPIDGPWLEVQLPVRPNGTRGWIRADQVSLAVNPYRIEIDASGRRLTVWERDRAVIETTVAIGAGSTPTPIGEFYLIELLRPTDLTGPYGTHAFGLSGFSETLESFNGGAGVVGIHGTNDPASLGTEVSHGCIRVANETIDEMASFLPLGTPVIITQ